MCEDGWYEGAAEWNEGDEKLEPDEWNDDPEEKLECGVKLEPDEKCDGVLKLVLPIEWD